MAVIGLIVHQGRPAATESARALSEWLTAAGHEVRMPPEEAESTGCPGLMVNPDRFADGLNAVVTLGGDGSILRSVELVGTSGIPVLGVDFGSLGYLSEVKPDGARPALQRVLSGEFEVEDRLLLDVKARLSDSDSGSRVSDWGEGEAEAESHPTRASAADRRSDGGVACYSALNEAFIERGPAFNTILLTVYLDGHMFTTYSADGLIVATPTGSTAYSFSARGPIIDPAHRALLLTPVSPHMLFDRSLVLPPSTEVRIAVDGNRPAVLSVDGRRVGELRVGDSVKCSASPHPFRFATFRQRRFHQILKNKFKLNGPPTR